MAPNVASCHSGVRRLGVRPRKAFEPVRLYPRGQNDAALRPIVGGAIEGVSRPLIGHDCRQELVVIFHLGIRQVDFGFDVHPLNLPRLPSPDNSAAQITHVTIRRIWAISEQYNTIRMHNRLKSESR